MYGHCSWCCPSPGIGLSPELILALLYYSYLLSPSGCNQISLVPWGWQCPFYHKLWLTFGGEDKKVESRWSFLSFLQCLLSLSPIYVTQGRIYQNSPNLVCDHQVESLKKKAWKIMWTLCICNHCILPNNPVLGSHLLQKVPVSI